MASNAPGKFTGGPGGSLIEGGPSLHSRISWGAIFAGATVALAVGLMLNVLGAAVGAMMVDTAARDTPSASSFGIGAGIWILISNLIALSLGGYVAARLSGTSDGTDGTLHGIAVWAATFLVSAVLLGNIVSGVVRRRVTEGTFGAPEKDRVNQLVAAEYKVSPQEAQQRVDRVEQQTKQALDQAEQRARTAADATARGATYTSFAIFLAMLLGMGAAIWGSRTGTRASAVYASRTVRSA